MSFIICYSTCWACKFDNCPYEPHVWWSEEDVWDEKPEFTKPLPEGRCGCPCALEGAVRPPEDAEEEIRYGSTTLVQ